MASKGATVCGTWLDSAVPMVDPSPTLGDLIKAKRLSLGWAQADVAAHFGVNQSTPSRWESNTHPLLPGDELIPRVAKWLDIPVEEVRGLKHDLSPSVTIAGLRDDVQEAQERVVALDERMNAQDARLGEALSILRKLLSHLGLTEGGITDDDPTGK